MLAKRIYHQGLARLALYWPALSRRLLDSFEPRVSKTIPWTPVTQPLEKSKIAIVTTAGIHHLDQTLFDMEDSEGDPTYRVIDAHTIEDDYRITHDYYDHRNAERDLNIIFPIRRLMEMASAGEIGAVSERHFSFMGHIDGRHVTTLMRRTAPRVAGMIKDLQADIVLLTPG